jgi:hypothetical protein
LKAVLHAIRVSSVCSPTIAVSVMRFASLLMAVNRRHASYGDCCSFNLSV